MLGSTTSPGRIDAPTASSGFKRGAGHPAYAIVPPGSTSAGLAAALLAGNGVGSLAVAALSAELIVHVGWREAMWWFGIAAMVVLIPITVVFHRHSAERVGLVPDGLARAAAHTVQPKAGATIGDAVRTRHFWLLALAVSMTGVCTMIIVVHQTRMLVDMGYGLTLASLIFGVLGVLRALGGLIWGSLSDRIGRSACVLVICGISLVGLALLWLASLVPAESAALRIALLVGYLLTFGLGFNGIGPVYAPGLDRFSGKNRGTIPSLTSDRHGSAAGQWGRGMVDSYGRYTAHRRGRAGVVVARVALWAHSARGLSAFPLRHGRRLAAKNRTMLNTEEEHKLGYRAAMRLSICGFS